MQKGDSVKRFEVIQGCRFVAIFMIYLAHTRSFLVPGMELFSDFGEKGVYIFIVLSGILLYRNSGRKNYAGTIKDGMKYAILKIKSLYWLHFLMWLVMFIVTVSQENLFRSVVYSAFNLTLTQSFIPFSGIINSFNGPSWYLSMCMFLWVLTPPYINWYNKRMKNGDLIRTTKRMNGLLILTWLIWLNCGTLLIWVVQNKIPQINSDWFSRWLLYSCPVLDFVIYLLAFWNTKLFCDKIFSYSKTKMTIAVVVVLISMVTKGEIPIVYNIPFVLSIIYIINYLIDHPELLMSRALSRKGLVFAGNISSYFFLIHGPVNMIINKTILAAYTPIAFFISLVISSCLSMLAYTFHLRMKKRPVVQ